jgi:hypothetical protein
MYKVAPILPALNLNETACFYRDKMQLSVRVYANYLIASSKYIELHFYKAYDKYLCENSSCYIMVNDIEDLYILFSSMDIIRPADKLETKAWGVKEFSIIDNSGNILRFAQRI